MVRKLKLFPDPILRQKAREVTEINQEIISLAEDLVETMYHYDGLGLSANQIGELLRVIAVNTGEILNSHKDYKVFVNPVVIYTEGEEVDEEGCLSFPNLYYDIKRPYLCTVKALELTPQMELRPVEITATGLYARVLLHEIDHLNGILFIDYIPPNERVKLIREWKRKLKSSDTK